MKRQILKWYKRFFPEKCSAISSSERYVLIIMLNLIKKPNVELLLHPQKDEFYINAEPYGMLIIGNNETPRSVTVVNHKYHYIIPFSERAMTIFKDRFINTTIERRKLLQQKYLNNTENSLKCVNNNIKNYERTLD